MLIRPHERLPIAAILAIGLLAAAFWVPALLLAYDELGLWALRLVGLSHI